MGRTVQVYDIPGADLDVAAFVSCLTEEEQRAVAALIQIFGGDSNKIIDHLMRTIVVAAILAGVDPQKLYDGLAYHWNFAVERLNRNALEGKTAGNA